MLCAMMLPPSWLNVCADCAPETVTLPKVRFPFVSLSDPFSTNTGAFTTATPPICVKAPPLMSNCPPALPSSSKLLDKFSMTAFVPMLQVLSTFNGVPAPAKLSRSVLKPLVGPETARLSIVSVPGEPATVALSTFTALKPGFVIVTVWLDAGGVPRDQDAGSSHLPLVGFTQVFTWAETEIEVNTVNDAKKHSTRPIPADRYIVRIAFDFVFSPINSPPTPSSVHCRNRKNSCGSRVVSFVHGEIVFETSK